MVHRTLCCPGSPADLDEANEIDIFLMILAGRLGTMRVCGPLLATQIWVRRNWWELFARVGPGCEGPCTRDKLGPEYLGRARFGWMGQKGKEGAPVDYFFLTRQAKVVDVWRQMSCQFKSNKFKITKIQKKKSFSEIMLVQTSPENFQHSYDLS